jgi:hypothetical protein
MMQNGTMDWAKHFGALSRGRPSPYARAAAAGVSAYERADFGGEWDGVPYPSGTWRGYWGPHFGSDQFDAVLAYRKIWDPYVIASLRAMRDTAAALNTLPAAKLPAGWTQAELTSLASGYQTQSDLGLQSWNMFAGTAGVDRSVQSQVMLKGFRDLIASIKRFWNDERLGKISPAAWLNKEPTEPSAADQNAVDRQIKISGVETASQWDLLFAGWFDKTGIPQIKKWAKEHGAAIAVVSVVVGGLVLIGVLTPILSIAGRGVGAIVKAGKGVAAVAA